ncbi:MAG: cytochrome P450, partial [Acidobacteriota bacterium]
PTGLITNPIPNPFQIRKLEGILRQLDDAYYGAIRQERERGAEGNSMLALLIRHEDDAGRFTDQELRDQLVTLYMAGFETTASSIAWLFYRLHLDPAIKQRFYDQADSIAGAEDFASFNGLELVRRCIQETLRMYPPAYNFSRVPLEDQTLGDYDIPAGHMVIVAPWATHRIPEYWPEPERFDPDRFLPEAVAARPRYTYLPFGAGHRTCIGMGLSAVQSQVLVTRLAQRYDLELAPDIPVEYVPGTVMRPKYGMNMTIKER